MEKIRLRHILVTFTVLAILTGCTLPGFSTPTPFSFPTPDKTMTALFEPTQVAPATSASSSSSSEDGEKTATPKTVPTSTPKLTETEDSSITETPEVAKTIEVTYGGPAVRSGPSVSAKYMESGNAIDGDLAGWTPPIQKVITEVVYGKDNWTGSLDASGSVVIGWNEDYLFIGVRVKDSKYVQEGVKEQIYLGDSIEILFDRYVSADYYLHAMSADDYQIGISPGQGGIVTCSINSGKTASMSLISPPTTCDPSIPQAYMWFPKTEAGKKTEIKVGAIKGAEGYQVEIKIPWSLIGVTNPSEGDHYGFAISISDNDLAGTLKQQTVVSNVPGRFYADPTTWGDLYLK